VLFFCIICFVLVDGFGMMMMSRKIVAGIDVVVGLSFLVK
jgi:hypothetical protein